MARTKKNVETGDGTFDVKAFANAMVELHDQESLPIEKVKELLTESMLKSYKDWWCIKNGFKNNKELNNSADLKATIYIDWEKGKYHICDAWEIVPTDDDIEDDFYQVSLEKAQENGVPQFKKDMATAKLKDAAKVRDTAKTWEKKVDLAIDENEKAACLKARDDEIAKAESMEKEAHDLVDIKVGGLSEVEIDNRELGVLYTRRVYSDFRQRMKKEAMEALDESVKQMIGHNITGVVQSVEGEAGRLRVVADFGKATGVLEKMDLLESDNFQEGQPIKAFLIGTINREDGKPSLRVSRTSEGYVKALFQNEVPEVADGTVVIKKIARMAGVRTKMMVMSNFPNVSATGALVGQNANRSRNILAELGRETVDFSEYTQDKVLNILNALKPADIVGLRFPPASNPTDNIYAICANGNKKVAIGKMGCNVRLAGKLIGHDLKIMEVDEALAMNISYTPVATLIAEANARLKKLEEAKTSKEENEADSSTTIHEPIVEAPVEAPVEEQTDNVQAVEAPAVAVPEEAKGVVDALKQAEADEKAKAVDEQNVKLGLQSQREEEQGILPEEYAIETSKTVAPDEAHVEITGHARKSIEDIEHQIERDREKNKNKGNRKPWTYNKPKTDKKKEEPKKETQPVEQSKVHMDIYTEDELKQLDNDQYDDDNNDFDDSEEYDDYYDSMYDDDEKRR